MITRANHLVCSHFLLPAPPPQALLANNNISVPLALFGTSANDRVLVERIQLLANVADGQDLFDVGTFRLNCSKSTTSNRMKVGFYDPLHRLPNKMSICRSLRHL